MNVFKDPNSNSELLHIQFLLLIDYCAERVIQKAFSILFDS